MHLYGTVELVLSTLPAVKYQAPVINAVESGGILYAAYADAL